MAGLLLLCVLLIKRFGRKAYRSFKIFFVLYHGVKPFGVLIRFQSESSFQIEIQSDGRQHMSDTLQRGERTARDVYNEHARMLYRIAFTYMKNPYDSEDALQECFVRFIRGKVSFMDPQHEKGWLIVTITNVCRDMLKSRHRQHENLDDHTELAAPPPEADGLMEAILKLPDKYKAAIYLHYYEGYSVKEIAAMLRQPSNTVKTWLSRARKLLKNELGGDLDA